MTAMTEKVLAFQESNEGLSALVEEIGVFVYEYAKRKNGWKHDDACDFYISFYPRVPKIVSRFTYTGVPFEAYLHISLKWHIRSFASQKNRSAATLRVFTRDEFLSCTDTGESVWLDDCPEDALEDEQPISITDPTLRRLLKTDAEGNLTTPASRRRLLLMLLREAEHLEPRVIEKLIRWGSFEASWFYDRVALLRERLEAKRARKTRLEIRRNHLFFRLYALQDALDLACEEVEKEQISARIESIRHRFARVLTEITKASTRPTHRDLAEVLEIPKGSVDSGFYAIRHIQESAASIDDIDEKAA